jgi:hypothetical protein
MENKFSEVSFRSGAPPFRGVTLSFEPAESGMIRVTVTIEPLDGTSIQTSYVLREDGKDYPVTNAPFDSISITPIDATTSIVVGKRNSKIIENKRQVVDGNTMTLTSIGIDKNVEVLDKR